DSFLTIEFHELDREPDKIYEGPYQGKYSAGREVLDSLVRLEGMTLTQIQSQFTELEKHVKAWGSLSVRADDYLQLLTELIRELKQTRDDRAAVPRDIRGGYKALVHHEEGGRYWAEVPELPGCFTQGETLDEIYRNLVEAISVHLDLDTSRVRIESLEMDS